MSSTRSATERPARHLGAGAALSVAADVGTYVAAGAVSVILARAIGPSANGRYALLLTLVNIGVLVASVGLSAGITYEVSHRGWPQRRAFATTSAVALALGILGAGAGFGFYALARHGIMRSVSFHLAAIALIAMPAMLVWQFTTAILLARDRYEGYTGLLLLNAVLTLFGSGGLAVAFGLSGAIAGFTASGFITAAAGAWLLAGRRGRPAQAPPAPDHEPAPRHLSGAVRFGVQAWVANILQQANYRLDLLILGAYALAAHVGVYSVAVTITAIAWILPHGLQTVLFPRAARLDAEAKTGELTAAESDAAVTRATRHTTLLTLPSGLIVALLLAMVPLVYGPKFDESVALGFILLPGVLIIGIGKVFGSVVSGRGRPRYMLYSGIVGAAITVAMYLVLIPPYHEWGAAAASTVSYTLTTVIVIAFFRRVTGIPLRGALIPTRADVGNYAEALAALRIHLRVRRAERHAT